MKQIAGIVIDSLAFAREGRHLIGQLAVKELPRLTGGDTLADDSGVLSCQLSGGRNEEGKLFLLIEVVGELHLKCQRCLDPLALPLDIKSRVLLVPSGAPWPDESLEDDAADAIEALAEQPVASLIEEEVLLALPVVPRHESCVLPGGSDHDNCAASPFAALAQLK
jgi:uncharacterized protein